MTSAVRTTSACMADATRFEWGARIPLDDLRSAWGAPITLTGTLKAGQSEAPDGRGCDECPSLSPAELRDHLLAGFLGMVIIIAGPWLACAMYYGR